MLLDEELEDRLALDALGCQASTCSRNGATRDCSWAGRAAGGAASKAASVAGSGNGPVSSPCVAAQRR